MGHFSTFHIQDIVAFYRRYLIFDGSFDGDVAGGEDETGRYGGSCGVYLEQCGAAIRGSFQGGGREGRVERLLGGVLKWLVVLYIACYNV